MFSNATSVCKKEAKCKFIYVSGVALVYSFTLYTTLNSFIHISKVCVCVYNVYDVLYLFFLFCICDASIKTKGEIFKIFGGCFLCAELKRNVFHIILTLSVQSKYVFQMIGKEYFTILTIETMYGTDSFFNHINVEKNLLNFSIYQGTN